MPKIIICGIAATAMLLSPAAVNAQTRTIVSGQNTVTLRQSFLQKLAAFGLVITNDNGTSLENGATTFPILEGTLDLQTEASELLFSGGYFASYDRGAITYRVLDFTVEQTSPTSSIVSAQFIGNDRIFGRLPVFLVHGIPPNLPVSVPPSGTLSVGLTLTLAPELVWIINSSLHMQAVTTDTTVGTANVVEVLNPDGR